MAVTSVIGKQIINVDNDTNYYFVVAPQGDSQARYVDITLTTNGGTPYIIPTGSTIILEGKNAGGYNIFNSCDLSQDRMDEIRVPLTNGVLSFAGVGKYIIGIYHNETYINSFSFNIVVTEAPYDVIALEASDSYEALNEIIARAADSNGWIVNTIDPIIDAECPEGTHKNDYYLNANTGDVFYAKLDTTTNTLKWDKVINELTHEQLNILEKMYVRYADDIYGGGFSKISVGKAYIGFYGSVNKENDSDPNLDINIPSNYHWSLLGEMVNENLSTVLYGTSNDKTIEPSVWSTEIPDVENDEFLWTKVDLVFVSGAHVGYKTAVAYHIDAGFAENAVTASVIPSLGKPNVNVTESGGAVNKSFDLAFEIRGGTWKFGTQLSGSGSITSTIFNETNTVVGDTYVNTTTKQVYECTSVSRANSIWNQSFALDTITVIDDLSNTLRFYGTIIPGDTSIIINESNPHSGNALLNILNDSDASGDTYCYHIGFKCSKPKVAPRSYIVNIGDSKITASLEFRNVAKNMEIIPVGTENPQALGWYEVNPSSSTGYSLTADTSVILTKKYYETAEICMEVIKKNR